MLSNHPANLVLRFVLEIVALVGIGQWGWQAGASFESNPARYLLAIGLPLLLAAIWAAFRTPEDSPQGGKGIIAIPGRVRLSLEIVFFLFAVWCFFAAGSVMLGVAFLFMLLLHYFWSLDRVMRLLRQP